MSGVRIRGLAALAALAWAMAGGVSVYAQGVFDPEDRGEPVKKSPVPSTETQSKTLELIREVFKKEYEEAKTPSQKEALAATLVERGLESEDTTERFVLLRVARDLAAMAGEAELACRAIDDMGQWYEVDAAAMKREALAKADKAATSAEQSREVAEQAAALAEAAILADDYAAAQQMVQMALGAAKKARDPDLLERVAERAKEVADVSKAKAQIQEALATLQKSPGDPAANLAVGRFYCFYRGDWAKGLPMLALAADGVYDALAKRELVGAAAAEEQLSIADGWFELIGKHQGMAQAQIRAHAASWYEKALAQLTGLSQMRVKKRLEEIEAAESGPEEKTAAKPGDTPSKTTAARGKPSFAGKWLDNFGSVIEMTVEGRNVTGTYKNVRKSADGEAYTAFEGRITGAVTRDGRNLSAQWTRSGRWVPGNARAGALAFTLAKDGASFSGTYRQSDGSGAGAWSGTRLSDKIDGVFDPPASYNNQDDPGGPPRPWRNWGRRPRG